MNWVDYLMAFLVGGLICLIAQILLDCFRLLPVHLIVLFVIVGSFLEILKIYDWLIKIGRAGALVPISSFGHSLTHAALLESEKIGYLGILTGVFDLTAGGIASAILFAFIIALVFKPKG
jgi:stage V sporulation protein AE